MVLGDLLVSRSGWEKHTLKKAEGASRALELGKDFLLVFYLEGG